MLDVAEGTREENEINRPAADGLVCDMNVPATRVSRSRHQHSAPRACLGDQLAPQQREVAAGTARRVAGATKIGRRNTVFVETQ